MKIYILVFLVLLSSNLKAETSHTNIYMEARLMKAINHSCGVMFYGDVDAFSTAYKQWEINNSENFEAAEAALRKQGKSNQEFDIIDSRFRGTLFKIGASEEGYELLEEICMNPDDIDSAVSKVMN